MNLNDKERLLIKQARTTFKTMHERAKFRFEFHDNRLDACLAEKYHQNMLSLKIIMKEIDAVICDEKV